MSEARFLVSQELYQAGQTLKKSGCESGVGDARKLMALALGVKANRLTLHLQDEIGLDRYEDFWGLVRRRVEREPMSHILGGRDFFGRWFKVNYAVLDPRPETETLIEAALAEPFSALLDLGTGSGAIAVTLLAERRDAVAVASDVSEAALRVAEENAAALGVAERVHFKECSWFAGIGGQYDLIVSNPPYIAREEMEGLAPELSFEPRIALTDEGDGLAAYRAIAAGAPGHLRPGGRLLVEIGWRQAADVVALFEAAGLQDIQVLPDLDGRDRVVAARNR